MKKTLIAVSLIAALGLTSCGINSLGGNEEATTENTTASTEEASTEETTKATRARKTTEAADETTTATSSSASSSSTSASTDTTTTATTKAGGSAEVKPVEGLGSNYADLDNRAFAYDGKVYKLGESTFQDLIDGGVPFKEKDLNNKDNNINKNTSSTYITIDVTDYTHIQVVFSNFTDSDISQKDCVITSVRWYPLYVPSPNYDDERNADIEAEIAESQKHIQFAFPLTLKKDELLAACPDGEEDNYNNVSYRIDSTKYYGKSGYTFDFSDDTDQLEDVTISYLP